MKQFKLLILLLVVGFVAEAQVNYLPNRSRNIWIAGKFDSTLHIPFGTTPSLRTGGHTGSGAVFYKTSDSTIYVYTGTQWISVKGAGGSADSTIFATLYRIDTAKSNIRTTLNTKIDSMRRVGLNVQAYKNGTWITQFTDSVGSGSGDGIVSLGTSAYGLITQNDSTYKVDSALLSTKLWRQKGIDSVQANINLKVNISDTASMLSPYLRKIDTTNKWITSVYRKTASDSVFYVKGGTATFAYRDSIGSGGGGGVTTIATINGTTKSANGAVISGSDFYMQTVDGTYPGLMTSAQKARLDSNSYLTIDKRYDSLAWERNDSTLTIKSLRIQNNGVTVTPTVTDSTLSFNLSSSGSYTFTQGLTESGGTVKLANNRNIEYITQPSTGSSLGSGWTAVSSPSYTVSGGKFVFTGGANNYTQYIRNDAGVLSERSSVEAYVIINTAGTTDQGVRIGWISYNSFGYAHNVHAGYISGTSAGSTGKAILYGSTGASSSYSDSARTSSDGDTLYYRLTRVGLAYTIYVKNLTKGWKLSKTVQTTPLGSPFVAHNSAYVAVIPGAGAYTVYGLKYTVQAPVVTENYIVGNSITYGQSAASEGARYASRIGYPGNNIGSGGGADATAQVLSRVSEIIAIKPQKVLLMIGGNDILFSVSAATWKANYLAIRDSLVNNGIEVVHLLPTPRTANDMRDLKYYIDTSSTFRSDKVIDTYTPLWSGTSYTMATKYNYDNTHPNEAGMGMIAATINDALHYNNGSSFEVNKNLIAKNGYVWGQDAGTGTDQYKAGGLIGAMSNSTTKYIQMGYYSSYGWIGAVTEGSSYDPLVLSPAGNTYVGIRETAPDVTLDVKNSTAGNASIMDLNHAGSYSAAGQELRVNFQNAGGNVSRIANFVDDGGSTFGFKFYTMKSGLLNPNPTLRLNGEDSASTFLGKLTIGTKLYITGAASGVGDKSVRFNISTKEVTYVDTIKTQSYTPSLTNTTNIAASTAYTTYYTVVGDMVHVWGTVDIDATAATTISEMGMTLPITGSIVNIYDIAGTAAHEDNTSVQIKADTANTRAMWRFTPQTDTNNKYSFHFTYKYVTP